MADVEAPDRPLPEALAVSASLGLDAAEINAGGSADPWVAGDTVFLLGGDARLLAVTRNEGRVRWAAQLPRYRDEEEKSGPIA